LYLLILEYDIVILKNDALFSIRKWKKTFVARQLAVLLYESSQDLPNLMGKEFRESLRQLDISDEEFKTFESVTRPINRFKKEHGQFLKKLRTYAGAHRDNNAALQLEVIEEVKLIEIMKLAGDLYEPIRRLISFLTEVITKMSDWKIILKNLDTKNVVS
jgi:hypothetical protein